MATTSKPARTLGVITVRTRWPVSRVSIAAGAVALAVIEAYGAITRAAGVPLRAAAFGAHTATQVNAGWLAFGVALGTFWGTVLAVVFARRANRPARTFLVTTLPLLALSLTGPLTAHATTATRLTLACGHLIAAAIIIPAVTCRLVGCQRGSRSRNLGAAGA
jgi:putative copper export protein